jgi:plasmid stabilization system protein ParE
MAYKVEITDRAQRDLAIIYRRIEAEVSAQAARWFGGMAKAILSLEEYPRRAPMTPKDHTLRHLLYGKKPYVYRIIYKVEEDTSPVYVLHIRPPRRDSLEKRKSLCVGNG